MSINSYQEAVFFHYILDKPLFLNITKPEFFSNSNVKEIFEIAKDNDLSLSEAEELQEFMKDNDFKDPYEAYEAWKSDK